MGDGLLSFFLLQFCERNRFACLFCSFWIDEARSFLMVRSRTGFKQSLHSDRCLPCLFLIGRVCLTFHPSCQQKCTIFHTKIKKRRLSHERQKEDRNKKHMSAKIRPRSGNRLRVTGMVHWRLVTPGKGQTWNQQIAIGYSH